jgi:hypothetical protein
VTGPDLPRPIAAGWKEYADFPDWGLRRVRVKLDTGARTTAVGVLSCEVMPAPEGGEMARLEMALYRRRPERRAVVVVPVVGTATIRNSGGQCETRPVVETTVRLGPVTKRIRVTIADRRRMLCPVILGRTALAGDFVVDVARKFVLPRPGP